MGGMILCEKEKKSMVGMIHVSWKGIVFKGGVKSWHAFAPYVE